MLATVENSDKVCLLKKELNVPVNKNYLKNLCVFMIFHLFAFSFPLMNVYLFGKFL